MGVTCVHVSNLHANLTSGNTHHCCIHDTHGCFFQRSASKCATPCSTTFRRDARTTIATSCASWFVRVGRWAARDPRVQYPFFPCTNQNCSTRTEKVRLVELAPDIGEHYTAGNLLDEVAETALLSNPQPTQRKSSAQTPAPAGTPADDTKPAPPPPLPEQGTPSPTTPPPVPLKRQESNI